MTATRTPALSANSLKILEQRYFEPGETADGMFRRVAAGDEDYIRIMRQLDFLPNSPTLMNAGTRHEGKSTFSACFKFDVADSMLDGPDCIIETMRKAVGVAKWGGGVGYYLGNLRAKNTPIRSVHRVACGPVAVLKVYNDIGTQLITQGGRRELAQMGILPWDHPDVREFIHVKDEDPQALRTFNISVSATDDFMQQALGDIPGENARRLWDEIIDSAWKTGDPGLFFSDVAERANPTPHLGRLTGTNPCGEVPLLNNEACLDASTLIDTPDGLVSIYQLLRRGGTFAVHTHNGLTVHNCVAINKGTRKTLAIRLNSGMYLRCTPDHRILTDTGWVEAGQLQLGSKVRVVDTATTQAGIAPQLEDEMLGWFTGDGWLTKEDSSGILFAKDDQEAMDVLLPIWDNFVEADYSLQLQPTGVRQKSCEKRSTIQKFLDLGFKLARATSKELPTYILEAESSRQLAFLRGLFSADGGVKKSGQGIRNIINLSSSSRKLLEQVQLMLMRYGIQSHIVWTVFRTEDRNPQGSLRIAGTSALAFREKIGFNLSAKNAAFEPGEQPNFNHEYFRVVSIEDAGETDVYDIAMPAHHHFIANGMIVHNCNLGSINLGHFVTTNRTIDYNRLEEVVRFATRFLDNILDRNSFPHEAVTKCVALTRKLGLGVMGWADMLCLMHIHYDSEPAVMLAGQLMKFINEVALDESIELAVKNGGPYPGYREGPEARNATRSCIAPTGTIAIFANASGSVEPHYALEWTRLLNAGVKDKEEIIREAISVIDESGGFIPHVANDIHWSWHVKHQAAFQKHTDLAVSKTINLPNNATREDVAQAYATMWRLGCKGGTIFRDNCRSGGEQVLKAATPATKIQEEAIRAAVTAQDNKFFEEIGSCRRRPPRDRNAKIHHVKVGNFDGYIHAGTYDDGKLCEVFITAGKEGSTVSGLLDSWAIAFSHALQYGDPLEALVDKFSGMRFEPAGMTGDPDIPVCTSIVDYVVRWLDKKFGRGADVEAFKGKEVDSGMFCPDCNGPAIFQGGCLTCKVRCGWSRCG